MYRDYTISGFSNCIKLAHTHDRDKAVIRKAPYTKGPCTGDFHPASHATRLHLTIRRGRFPPCLKVLVVRHHPTVPVTS